MKKKIFVLRLEELIQAKMNLVEGYGLILALGHQETEE